MKHYENTGSTGVPGRATARGLDRLNFYPIILLLVIVFGAVVVVVFFFNYDPRSSQEYDNQFAVIQQELNQVLGSRYFDQAPPIPDREEWRLRKMGDVDRWSATIEIPGSRGESTQEVLVTIEFNMKHRGLQPRFISGDF